VSSVVESYYMDLQLTGKVAMVGGASKGLGYAVARALAAEGAKVSIVSRDRSAVDRAAAEIKKETGAAVIATAGDLSSADAIDAWYRATVDGFGGIDLLYANTGGPPAGAALSFDDKAWQTNFDLLVLSVIRTTRLVVPSMQARGGGSILVGTSSSVKEPIGNLALSNVLRASVSSLAKTLSIELAPQKIRVNNLIPGRIETDRLKYLDEVNAKKAGVSTDEHRAKSAASVPLGRYGAPEEFGRAAAFLLSSAAAYITGASLQVDGGLIRGVL
jgi:3-oxoacyl-[acyl-carrier protein] reductase